MACVPTLLGYWSIGFASGAIGTVSGFSVWQIAMLSAFLYAGSAQFLFYSMWLAGAGVGSIVLGVLLINLRYLLISSYMAIYFTRAGTWEKLMGGALLTDETFGVAAQYGSRHGSLPFAWLSGLNLTAWLSWIGANLMGAWLAASLPPALVHGLGFSLVSMFIGLLLMIWLASRERMLDGVTIVVAMLVVVFTARQADSNLVIMLATMGAATLVTVLMRWRDARRKPAERGHS